MSDFGLQAWDADITVEFILKSSAPFHIIIKNVYSEYTWCSLHSGFFAIILVRCYMYETDANKTDTDITGMSN